VTQRSGRSFDAIPRVIAKREREKMKAHCPTSSGPRIDAIHAPLGVREILVVLPWRSAFRESSRVDSQQSAFRLAGQNGRTFLVARGPAASSYTVFRAVIVIAKYNGGSIFG
jgi:hypothetical protein